VGANEDGKRRIDVGWNPETSTFAQVILGSPDLPCRRLWIVAWPPQPRAVKTAALNQAAAGGARIVCDGLDISATVLCTFSAPSERAKSAWEKMPTQHPC